MLRVVCNLLCLSWKQVVIIPELTGGIDFDDPIQSLKWGALISPTDPVAILSVLGSLGPLKDEQLFSVIFGESVLNVCFPRFWFVVDMV